MPISDEVRKDTFARMFKMIAAHKDYKRDDSEKYRLLLVEVFKVALQAESDFNSLSLGHREVFVHAVVNDIVNGVSLKNILDNTFPFLYLEPAPNLPNQAKAAARATVNKPQVATASHHVSKPKQAVSELSNEARADKVWLSLADLRIDTKGQDYSYGTAALLLKAVYDLDMQWGFQLEGTSQRVRKELIDEILKYKDVVLPPKVQDKFATEIYQKIVVSIEKEQQNEAQFQAGMRRAPPSITQFKHGVFHSHKPTLKEELTGRLSGVDLVAKENKLKVAKKDEEERVWIEENGGTLTNEDKKKRQQYYELYAEVEQLKELQDSSRPKFK